MRYNVPSNLSFHAAYYRAFRAPNLAELYRKQVSPTSITVPNPFLKAENAEGREAGFDFQPIEWLQVKGTWYVADYNNFNVPTALTATSTPPRFAECGPVTVACRTRLNVNKSRSEGGEAYVALHPIPELFVSGSVNYDDDRQQSGLPATATDDTKPHINRVPSPKQTIRATYSSAQLGDWTAIWRHEGHTTTLQGVWLDPYSVVDVNVQREIVNGHPRLRVGREHHRQGLPGEPDTRDGDGAAAVSSADCRARCASAWKRTDSRSSGSSRRRHLSRTDTVEGRLTRNCGTTILLTRPLGTPRCASRAVVFRKPFSPFRVRRLVTVSVRGQPVGGA